MSVPIHQATAPSPPPHQSGPPPLPTAPSRPQAASVAGDAQQREEGKTLLGYYCYSLPTHAVVYGQAGPPLSPQALTRGAACRRAQRLQHSRQRDGKQKARRWHVRARGDKRRERTGEREAARTRDWRVIVQVAYLPQDVEHILEECPRGFCAWLVRPCIDRGEVVVHLACVCKPTQCVRAAARKQAKRCVRERERVKGIVCSAHTHTRKV